MQESGDDRYVGFVSLEDVGRASSVIGCVAWAKFLNITFSWLPGSVLLYIWPGCDQNTHLTHCIQMATFWGICSQRGEWEQYWIIIIWRKHNVLVSLVISLVLVFCWKNCCRIHVELTWGQVAQGGIVIAWSQAVSFDHPVWHFLTFPNKLNWEE